MKFFVQFARIGSGVGMFLPFLLDAAGIGAVIHAPGYNPDSAHAGGGIRE